MIIGQPLEVKKHGIYLLIDPLTTEVKYVGKADFGSASRLPGHISESRRRQVKSHKAQWVRSLLSRKHTPQIMWIDWCSSEQEALTVEQQWIACYRELGASLTNGTKTQDGSRERPLRKFLITVDLEKSLHTTIYEHMVEQLEKQSRKVRLGEFVREAIREKLAREK